MTRDEAAQAVVDEAMNWADAFPGYEAGAFGSSAYLHAREVLLRATIRQYRECCKNVADKKEDGLEPSPPMLVFRDSG